MMVPIIADALRTAQQAQRTQDAHTVRSLGILADKECTACGSIPERILREEIAQAIESAGVG